MTLQEEKMKIYQQLEQEVRDMKKSLDDYSRRIDSAIGSVKENDTGDARENAGLDIAKDDLVAAYKEILRIQSILSKFQEVEERDLYVRLFPEKAVPEYCLYYNHVGRAVLYSTLRVEVKRESGRVQDMILMLMPAGFNFKTMGCCSLDAPAARLMLNSKQGQTIPYVCPTGERVEYLIKEIL